MVRYVTREAAWQLPVVLIVDWESASGSGSIAVFENSEDDDDQVEPIATDEQMTLDGAKARAETEAKRRNIAHISVMVDGAPEQDAR